MWVDVFKPGNYENSDGSIKTWSIEDIDEIVEKYNNQADENRHIAPVVFGHPEDDAPALGWVERLRKRGKILQAKLVDLSEELIDGIRSGAYKFVSISLYPNKLLRHVGVLGAVPPKVKGLKPLSEYFNDKDGVYYNFVDISEVEGLDKLLINVIKDKYGEEILQDILAEYYFKKELINKNEEEAQMAEQFKDTQEYKELITKLSEATKQIEELRSYANRLEGENKELQFNYVFSELVNEGYLIPAQKDLFKAVINSEGYEFSDGKKDFKQTLIEFVKSFPKQIEINKGVIEEPKKENNLIEMLGLK